MLTDGFWINSSNRAYWGDYLIVFCLFFFVLLFIYFLFYVFKEQSVNNAVCVFTKLIIYNSFTSYSGSREIDTGRPFLFMKFYDILHLPYD